MKLPKILGLVLALHLALGAILVGCNSMKKQPPAPADTAAPAALITAPDAPVLNPPAEAASARFHPTRPASDARPGQPFEPAPVVNPYPIVADDTPPPAVREPEPAPGIPYTVVKGDSLNRIAKRHGVTVAALADANNLPRNATLKIGQKLSVPAARPSADKPAAAASGKTHTVLPGENLTVIARKHHTTVATLKSLNGLSGSALKAGQILQLPADEKTPAPAADAPASPAPAAGQLTHTVMPGEFLGGIARKYKVPLADLATLNNIPDPRKLQAGQLLKIPAGGRLPAAAPKPVEQQPAAAPAAQQPAAPATQPAPAAPVASPESAPDVPVIQADPAQPPVINLP